MIEGAVGGPLMILHSTIKITWECFQFLFITTNLFTCPNSIAVVAFENHGGMTLLLLNECI